MANNVINYSPPLAPAEGAGYHDYVLRYSRELLMRGASPELTKAKLLEASRHVNRTTQDKEIEIDNAIEGALPWLAEHTASRVHHRLTKWVDPNSFIGVKANVNRKDKREWVVPQDDKLIAKIIKDRASRSWHMLDNWEELGRDFDFKQLFYLDFNLCAGKASFTPFVKALTEWKWLDHNDYQFIVPNAFRECGKGEGIRTDYNIETRLFMVVEFDKGSLEEQYSLLTYLDDAIFGFRLAMIVWSANRSLHGWFTCYGLGEYKVRTFCRLTKKLGADANTREPSRWMRMPNGWNYKTARRQHVIYFASEALDDQHLTIKGELLE